MSEASITSAAPTAPRHALAGALRAVRVFTAAAFSVVVLGDYADQDGRAGREGRAGRGPAT